MHKWHAFLLYISEDGDLSPKHTRQFICMDKIRFYINCEHFLVHMDNRVKYFSYIFMCCWPCILVIFDFMFQLNAPFVYYIYHIPLHVSSDIVLIMRRIHCVCVYIYIYIYIYIYTASGSLYVTLLRWPLSPLTACALSGHLRRMTYKEPDAICIQWILLMMSTMSLETCRGIW